MGRANISSTPATHSRDFIGVYRHSVRDVYSYFASRVGDRSTAEDLTQEVFIAGARRFAAGDDVDTAWLIAVARHKLVDHWRARSREGRKLAVVHTSAPRHDPGTPVEDATATAALAELNLTYRAALVLRHVDDLSVAEVAAHLGRTLEATEQVLTRARTAFPFGTERAIPPVVNSLDISQFQDLYNHAPPFRAEPWCANNVTWSPDGTELLHSAGFAGLLAVPVDGARPAIVLSGDGLTGVNDQKTTTPWLPLQQWQPVP